jgi:hypothetical protein
MSASGIDRLVFGATWAQTDFRLAVEILRRAVQ